MRDVLDGKPVAQAEPATPEPAEVEPARS
jgi:hypothetical protein